MLSDFRKQIETNAVNIDAIVNALETAGYDIITQSETIGTHTSLLVGHTTDINQIKNTIYFDVSGNLVIKTGSLLTCIDVKSKTVFRDYPTIEQEFVIGQTGPAGGIIFFKGEDFYLEAALADIGERMSWGNTEIKDVLVGTGVEVGTGKLNTDDIIDLPAHTSSAASLCKAYDGGGYTDWFLPSIDELQKLYLYKTQVGGFITGYWSNYWSSSEYTDFPSEFVYAYDFNTGSSITRLKYGQTEDGELLPVVRPIRMFYVPRPPELAEQFVTKQYVDTSIASARFDEYFTTVASDFNGIYKVMNSNPVAVGAVVSSTITSSTTTNIFNFATKVGVPGLASLISGSYLVRNYLKKTGNRTINIYCEFYKYSVGGGEILLSTSTTSIALTAITRIYSFYFNLATNVILDPADRLIVKFYAISDQPAGDTTVTLAVGGNTPSHLEIDISTTELNNLFIPYTNAHKDIDLPVTVSMNKLGVGTTTPLGKHHVYQSLIGGISALYQTAQAKTVPASEHGLYFVTNELWANNPFGLELALTGAAAIANRYVSLQTKDVNLANGGNLIMQPSAGNVGIGTAAPSGILQVGAGSYSPVTGAYLVAHFGGLSLVFRDGRDCYIGGNMTYTGSAWVNKYSGYKSAQIAVEDGVLYFYTGSGTTAGSDSVITERMRLTNAGNLGLGTTSPVHKIHVLETAANWAALFTNTRADGVGYGLCAATSRNDASISLAAYSYGITGYTFVSRGDGLNGLPSTYEFTTINAANLHIHTDGFLYRSTSASRYKKDIEDIDKIYSENIYKLRPVWFRSICKDDNKAWSHWGLIAEEVALIDPRLVHWGYEPEDYEDVPDVSDSTGKRTMKAPKDDAELKPTGIQESKVIALMLDQIQEQKRIIAVQATKIEEMEARLLKLENLIKEKIT